MISNRNHTSISEKGNIGAAVLRFIIGLIACSFVMGGCAVGPDYIKPSAPEPEQWLEQDDARIQSEAEDYSQWWKVFNDPVLDSLVWKPGWNWESLLATSFRSSSSYGVDTLTQVRVKIQQTR